MQRMYIVEKVCEPRVFDAQKNRGEMEKVTSVGLVLTDGFNTIYGEAYRDVAKKVQEAGLRKNDWVNVKLTTMVRERSTDKGTFLSNNVTITGLEVMLKQSF